MMGKRMGHRFAALVTTCALAGAGAGVTHAAPMLDQSLVPPSPAPVSAQFGSTNFNQQRAQTFTAGISGLLTEVAVDAERFGSSTSGNLVLEVRDTNPANGFPVSNGFLLQTSVAANVVPPAPNNNNVFTAFDLSSFGLHVNAGDQLAIVLYAQGGSGYDFGWLGALNDPYPRGDPFERVIGNHDWLDEGAGSNGYDLGFQTFVDPSPAPEPSGLLLAGVGALGLLGYGWRRRRRAAAAGPRAA
jgi:MYXO-CTERM domain-containing protein